MRELKIPVFRKMKPGQPTPADEIAIRLLWKQGKTVKQIVQVMQTVTAAQVYRVLREARQ